MPRHTEPGRKGQFKKKPPAPEHSSGCLHPVQAPAAPRERTAFVTFQFYGPAHGHKPEHRAANAHLDYRELDGKWYMAPTDAQWSCTLPERLLVEGELMDKDDPRYVAIETWLRTQPQEGDLLRILLNRYPLILLTRVETGDRTHTPATVPRRGGPTFCNLDLHRDAPDALTGFMGVRDEAPGNCAFAAVHRHLARGGMQNLSDHRSKRLAEIAALGWTRYQVPALADCIPNTPLGPTSFQTMVERVFEPLQWSACCVTVAGQVAEGMFYHPRAHTRPGVEVKARHIPTAYFVVHGSEAAGDGHIEAVHDFKGQKYAVSFPYDEKLKRFVTAKPCPHDLKLGSTAGIPKQDTTPVLAVTTPDDIRRALFGLRDAMDAAFEEGVDAARAAVEAVRTKRGSKAQMLRAATKAMPRFKVLLTYVPPRREKNKKIVDTRLLYRELRDQGMLWTTSDGFKVIQQQFTWKKPGDEEFAPHGLTVHVMVRAQLIERSEEADPLFDAKLIEGVRAARTKYEMALMPADMLTKEATLTRLISLLRPAALNFSTSSMPADGRTHQVDHSKSYADLQRTQKWQYAARSLYDIDQFCDADYAPPGGLPYGPKERRRVWEPTAVDPSFQPRDHEFYVVHVDRATLHANGARVLQKPWIPRPEGEAMMDTWLQTSCYSDVDLDEIAAMYLDKHVRLCYGPNLREFMALCPWVKFEVSWVLRPSVVVPNPAPAALAELWDPDNPDLAGVADAAPAILKLIPNMAHGKMVKSTARKSVWIPTSSFEEAQSVRADAQAALNQLPPEEAEGCGTHVHSSPAHYCIRPDDDDWVVELSSSRRLTASFALNGMLVYDASRVRLVRVALDMAAVGLPVAGIITDAHTTPATPENDARLLEWRRHEPWKFVDPALSMLENCGRMKIDLADRTERVRDNRGMAPGELGEWAEVEALLPRREPQNLVVMPFEYDEDAITAHAQRVMDEHQRVIFLAVLPGSGKTFHPIEYAKARGLKARVITCSHALKERMVHDHGVARGGPVVGAMTYNRLLGMGVEGQRCVAGDWTADGVDMLIFEEVLELSDDLVDGLFAFSRDVARSHPDLRIMANGDPFQNNPITKDTDKPVAEGFDTRRLARMRRIFATQVWLPRNFTMSQALQAKLAQVMVDLFGQRIRDIIPPDAIPPLLAAALEGCPADQGFARDVPAVLRKYLTKLTHSLRSLSAAWTVLTWTNSTLDQHNNQVHKGLYAVGDTLFARYHTHFSRGARLTVTAVEDGMYTLRNASLPEAEGTQTLTLADVRVGFRHATARTVHSCQGDRLDHGVKGVVVDLCYPMLSTYCERGTHAKWAWVAITRSRNPFSTEEKRGDLYWAEGKTYYQDQIAALKTMTKASLPGLIRADRARGMAAVPADYVNAAWTIDRAKAQRWNCGFCNEPFTGDQVTIDRVNPDKGNIHLQASCQLVHTHCNAEKAALFEKHPDRCLGCDGSPCECVLL